MNGDTCHIYFTEKYFAKSEEKKDEKKRSST